MKKKLLLGNGLCQIRMNVKHFNVRSAFIVCLVCLLIPLPYLENFSVLSLLYTGRYLLAAFYILFIEREVRFSVVSILIILCNTCVFISTLLYSGFSASTCKTYISMVIFPVVLDVMLKKDAKTTTNMLAIFFEVAIYINFLAELLFPRGLYNISTTSSKAYFLFGQQNSLGLYLMIAFTLGIIRVNMNGKLWDYRLIALFVVGVASAVKVWSASTIVGCLLFITIYSLEVVFQHNFPLFVTVSLVGNAVFLVVVVILRNMSWMQGILSLLNRDVTLSTRTKIWDVALSSIKSHPLLGVGWGQGVSAFGFSSTHNRYLNTLYTGGIFAFAFFIVLICYVCYRVGKNHKKRICMALIPYICVTLLMFQVETYSSSAIYTVFVIAQNINVLEKAYGSAVKNEKRRRYRGRRAKKTRIRIVMLRRVSK